MGATDLSQSEFNSVRLEGKRTRRDGWLKNSWFHNELHEGSAWLLAQVVKGLGDPASNLGPSQPVTVLFFFFFLIFTYLAVLDLSYGTRDLCCIMQGLLLWYKDSLVVAPRLGCCGGWNPGLLHQKGDSLATGPPGKSLQCCLNGNKIWPDSMSSTKHIYK